MNSTHNTSTLGLSNINSFTLPTTLDGGAWVKDLERFDMSIKCMYIHIVRTSYLSRDYNPTNSNFVARKQEARLQGKC